MKEQLISFDTAKLAKEKGYNRIPEEIVISNNVDYTSHFDIPTQSLLQKWLSDNHDLIVLPCINDNGDGDWWISYNIWSIKDSDYLYENNFSIAFDSFEEALEVGLQKGLESIETENNL